MTTCWLTGKKLVTYAKTFSLKYQLIIKKFVQYAIGDEKYV